MDFFYVCDPDVGWKFETFCDEQFPVLFLLRRRKTENSCICVSQTVGIRFYIIKVFPHRILNKILCWFFVCYESPFDMQKRWHYHLTQNPSNKKEEEEVEQLFIACLGHSNSTELIACGERFRRHPKDTNQIILFREKSWAFELANWWPEKRDLHETK
jgi:hypothetical protein